MIKSKFGGSLSHSNRSLKHHTPADSPHYPVGAIWQKSLGLIITFYTFLFEKMKLHCPLRSDVIFFASENEMRTETTCVPSRQKLQKPAGLSLWSPSDIMTRDIRCWRSINLGPGWGYHGEKLPTSCSFHTLRWTCHANKNINRWCCLWLKHNHDDWHSKFFSQVNPDQNDHMHEKAFELWNVSHTKRGGL